MMDTDTFPENILSRFQEVRTAKGGGWEALCPAHDDHSPSLSINTGTDGRLLLKCFTGCATEDICKAVGLKLSDLFAPKPPKVQIRSRIVETYSYTNAEGKELFQVCRREPGKNGRKKDFQQRHTGPDGRWIWNINGIQRQLYHLPRVLSAIERGETIFLPEGERKVHALEAFGLTATCNAGGAGKWQETYTDALTGMHVCILPDNDEPGKHHAALVAGQLHGKAASIRIVDLPNLPLKGDIVDWARAGGTREQLLALYEQTAEWQPQNTPNPARPLPLLDTLTDLGNAERLIVAHGKNLRYDVDSEKWLVWNGCVWTQDDTGQVHRMACEVVRSMHSLLSEVLDKDDNAKLYNFIRRSQNAERLAAMVKLAQYRPGIPVRSSELDSDPWLFCCQNGTVDLRTGELRTHRQEDLCTKLAPVRFDPQAECSRWNRFLKEVFCEDDELATFVQRMCGYLLTGDTREQAFFLLVGKGSNGKGVFTNTLTRALGDYAKDTPVTTFLEKRGENSSDLASLAGSRLVTASEGEDTTSFNEALVKRLTGQDSITARYLYKEYFSFHPTFKILFATNEVPRIRSQNYAIKRRVKLIPFRQRFYYSHEQKAPSRDESLGSKLSAELPGILAWAIRGCLDWQAEGLGMPEAIHQEVDSLFESMDSLAEFIESRCIIHPGAKVEAGRLWNDYTEWCKDTGRTPAFKQTHRLTQNLCQRDGIERRRGGKGVRYLVGIGLLDDRSPSQVTQGDAKTDFRESPLEYPSRREFSEKSDNASPCVTRTTDSPATDPPTEPCGNCSASGSENWRWEPMTAKSNGRWVCRMCSYAAT